MKVEHIASSEMNGDSKGLLKEMMKDFDPTLYVESVDGRVIPVCRLVKEESCPQELFEIVVKMLLQED